MSEGVEMSEDGTKKCRETGRRNVEGWNEEMQDDGKMSEEGEMSKDGEMLEE